MKLGLLGFAGNSNSIGSRTNNLGIYRPESNRHIQDFNGNAKTYQYVGKFVLSFNGASETSITGLTFGSNGTYVYVMGGSTYTVYQYTLNIPWDITSYSSVNPTASRELTSYLMSQTGNIFNLTMGQGLTFSSDGSKMHVIDNNDNKIVQFSLGTNWMVNTATFPTSSPWPITYTYNLGSGETFSTRDDYDLCFSPDGTLLFLIGRNSSPAATSVYKYTLNSGATAFDIGTTTTSGSSTSPNYTYSSKSSVSALDTAMRGISFNDSGSKIYLCGTTNAWTHEITLSSPYTFASSYSFSDVNLGNIFYDGSITGNEGSPQAVFINSQNNNSDLYIVGTSKNTIYQYKPILK